MRALSTAALCLSLFGAPAWAGDAQSGARLADQWCASCHLVAPGQASASDVAPPFAEIAADPSKTKAGLEAWLADPHPPMPKLNLSNQEIANLISYIESLNGN